ncbi:hypothetical protein COU54_01095 [Candidatus Pacearchaeota archaeon CG10_big_fil_rev_8_21_14_0_10_31_24]|nr:MAG: hypothetical protein COU54_01095 [Candidatus Pacearchaeota archaeon CG10_big_fil_rev_8_21_14_0_10_31_24]
MAKKKVVKKKSVSKVASKSISLVSKPSVKNVSAGVPTGVKVIGILAYIGAVWSLLSALAAWFLPDLLIKYKDIPELGVALGPVMIIAGFVSILFAIIYFFIGRGLLRAQKWARIIVIVFSVISVLTGLLSLIAVFSVSTIVWIIIDGFIGGYLWFNQEVKSAFR